MNGLTTELQKTYLSIFKELESNLIEQDWYLPDWHFVLNDLDGFATCQLYRPAWLITADRPIHFEAYIGAIQHEQGRIPLLLHAHPTFPQQFQLAELFRAKAQPSVKNWTGYSLTRPVPFQLLRTEIAFMLSDLRHKLLMEFTRVQELGPLIDQLISEIKQTNV